MAKITAEMVKQTYIMAKKMYNNEIDRCDGLKTLFDRYGMNENSARMYIYNFRYLINGKTYRRIMKVDDTQYFLMQILNDYGENTFKKALYSVKQHIEYIKKINNSSNVEQLYKELVKKYNIKDENIPVENDDNNGAENDNNDYAIQNILAELKVRQKQSKFRKRVLENFNGKCCRSGIKEVDLLRASHIVPWSQNIKSRLDPSNGLCLFVLYDVLFDQGYFSLSDNYKVIVPNSISSYSIEIQNILLSIKDKEILKPVKKIKLEYIKYHREKIFIQKNGT
jgi:predicted restriction endonuclease